MTPPQARNINAVCDAMHLHQAVRKLADVLSLQILSSGQAASSLQTQASFVQSFNVAFVVEIDQLPYLFQAHLVDVNPW